MQNFPYCPFVSIHRVSDWWSSECLDVGMSVQIYWFLELLQLLQSQVDPEVHHLQPLLDPQKSFWIMQNKRTWNMIITKYLLLYFRTFPRHYHISVVATTEVKKKGKNFRFETFAFHSSIFVPSSHNTEIKSSFIRPIIIFEWWKPMIVPVTNT